jgi:hypothetical protein
MRIEDFNVVFKRKKKVLYCYFLKMIREKTKYSGDLHVLLRDLIDLTYTEAYMKILEGGLSRLPIQVIIMIKAKDVFYEHFRVPKKKPQLVEMPPMVYDQASLDPDPYQKMVLQQDMETIDTLLNDAGRKLLENVTDEVPSRVIAADLSITLTALSSRIHRLRMELQKHLEKGF